MSICDRHGGDIAYTGVDCPACTQIEMITDTLKDEHQIEVDDLLLEIDDLQVHFQELEDKLGEE